MLQDAYPVDHYPSTETKESGSQPSKMNIFTSQYTLPTDGSSNWSRDQSLPIQGTILWTLYSSPSSLQSPPDSGCLLTQTRHHHISILRWLFPQGPSKPDVLHAVQLTMDLFSSLDLCINLEKSKLSLVQHLEFIWAQLDTIKARHFLPPHRFSAIVNLICTVRTCSQISTRMCL